MSAESTPSQVDDNLLRAFKEIESKVPHLEGSLIQGATPLIDITAPLIDCSKEIFNLNLNKNIKILGKLDSEIYGGSIKVRPAINIIGDAIRSGKLRIGQTIFEATSGNFGLALGLLTDLGIDVVVLVSRKLQEGVLEELGQTSVKRIDLDVDICPAPGVQLEQNVLVAKTVALNTRRQLTKLGLNTSTFDQSQEKIESLLAKQDTIGLAKFLAKIYGGFCPEQYENELNVKAHEEVTGPELDQQLQNLEEDLGNYGVICTFGTGGTSTGLSQYIQTKYKKKNTHVVFPQAGQNVAGIRTKEKALGLTFYDPSSYAGEHEVDFEPAKALLKYFVKKGFNIGESSALELYACMQLVNFGVGNKFIVILADGISKYAKTIVNTEEPAYEISLDGFRSNFTQYDSVLWTHGMFSPKEEGRNLIASSTGFATDNVHIASASDVNSLLATQNIPDKFQKLLPKNGKPLLVVCMVGGTSLQVAKILEEKGIPAVSLTGGITGLADGRPLPELIQVANE